MISTGYKGSVKENNSGLVKHLLTSCLGVGGWSEYNIDPRDFPQQLMDEVKVVLHEGSKTDVVDILNSAFENSKHIIGMNNTFSKWL